MTIAIMKLWQNGRNAKGVARRTLRPERLSADGKQKSRTEQQIAEEVRRLASESVRISLGRRFLGFEVEGRYVEMARRRVREDRRVRVK